MECRTRANRHMLLPYLSLSPSLLYSAMVALVFASVIFLSGCGNSHQEITPSLPREVAVITVEQTAPMTNLVASGSFSYKITHTLAFETGGTIVQMPVEENQLVQSGELLSQINTQDLSFQVELAQTQLEQAKLSLKLAEKGATQEQITMADSQYQEALITYEDMLDQYTRLEELYQAGAIPERQLKDLALQLSLLEQKIIQAEANLITVKSGAQAEELDLLRKGVDQAEVVLMQSLYQLEKTEIRAPFKGVILSKLANQGDLVGSGQPVFVVADHNSMIFTFGAASNQLVNLTPGQQLLIELDHQPANTANQPITGTISQISWLPDPATRLYQVEVQIPSSQRENLRAGMTGQITAEFSTGSPLLLLPPQAIVSKAGRQVVYVVSQDDFVTERNIITGQFINGQVEVMDGLTAGDIIVVEGAPFLADGEQISIKEEGDKQ